MRDYQVMQRSSSRFRGPTCVIILWFGCGTIAEPVPVVDAGKSGDPVVRGATSADAAPMPRVSRCGDGTIDPERNEQCDDANTVDHDGCTGCRYDCQSDAECDDGNPCNGLEICVGQCQRGSALSVGAACSTAAIPSGHCRPLAAELTCVSATCGDGRIEGAEHCDDGNIASGDGCENDCRYSCETNPAILNTWYADCDRDGFVSADAIVSNSCLPPQTMPCGGEWILDASADQDCDDQCAQCYPGAVEVCDGRDNNCVGGADEIASCHIECDWNNAARWLSHGWDGGGAFDAGAWVSCIGHRVSHIEWKQDRDAAVTPTASGSDDVAVGCNWTDERWASQGWDREGAWGYGAAITCASNRVTKISWAQNDVAEQPASPGQLACNWMGARFLSHGWDFDCAFATGFHVTCHDGRITHIEWVEGCGRNR